MNIFDGLVVLDVSLWFKPRSKWIQRKKVITTSRFKFCKFWPMATVSHAPNYNNDVIVMRNVALGYVALLLIIDKRSHMLGIQIGGTRRYQS